MSRIERAKQFKKMLDANLIATRGMIRVDEMAPGQLEGLIDLYPQFDPNGYPYLEGELFQYEGKLYKTTLNGAMPSQLDWIPSELPALYDPITPPDTIAEWEQRYGHNPYFPGDQVLWNSQVYMCIETTTYSPADVPTAWLIFTEDPDLDLPEISEWIQPTGAHDSYSSGDRVKYNGVTYISTVDNNTWKPDEYGWAEFDQ